MSYARFSKTSSVYVFRNTDLLLECCACYLMSPGNVSGVPFLAETVDDMIEHLHEHEAAGGRVPAETYESLRTDREIGELR